MILRWLRRDDPPSEATQALDRDERVVSWASTVGGDVVVATQRGLWLPDDGGERRRLEWHLINKAVWGDGELVLTEAVEVSPGVVVDGSPIVVEIETPRDLPKAVHRRVTGSVAVTEHFELSAGGGVRIVARRVSGADGLRWVMKYDKGTATADPAVRAEAEELLRETQAAEVPDDL